MVVRIDICIPTVGMRRTRRLSVIAASFLFLLFLRPFAKFAFELFFHLVAYLVPLSDDIRVIFVFGPLFESSHDLLFDLLAYLLPLFVALSVRSRTAGGVGTAAPDDDDAQQETEVIPAARIVDLVDGDILIEEMDDERNKRDHPVPESIPEPGRLPLCELWVTGGACRKEEEQREDEQYFV